MLIFEGFILTPQGFIEGRLQSDATGHIGSIIGTVVDEARARSGRASIALPGFIDLHVHGGGGNDIMEGGKAALQVSRLHVMHGTTALLATTMTAPIEDLVAAFTSLAPLCSIRGEGAARVLGVHLEGPYINDARLGAQPSFARPVDLRELQLLHGIAPIRLLTLAPEVSNHLILISQLVRLGMRVQLGHTCGTYEQGVAALRSGATGFTHLFNAMSALHHREPGMVGAALAHADYAEIIPDLLHVHPGAIRAALRSIPKLYCVTDSTAAAGMPDGDYQLGRHTVTKCLGGVRLANGTLAGSVLTMDAALQNLVNTVGISLEEASRRVSTYAAEYLGIVDRGCLIQGAWADVVLMDSELRVQEVWVEGEKISLSS